MVEGPTLHQCFAPCGILFVCSQSRSTGERWNGEPSAEPGPGQLWAVRCSVWGRVRAGGAGHQLLGTRGDVGQGLGQG